MATKRRPRKPLRSELSDGIKKDRQTKPIKTFIPSWNGSQTVKENLLNKSDKIEEYIEVEESIEDFCVKDTEVEEHIHDKDFIESQSEVEVEESEEDVDDVSDDTPNDEDELRAKAKELGISHWWTKKVKKLKSEIEALESEVGEEL